MGENIGAAARAMMNCGISRLRLVKPRDGYPSEKAEAMSAGALEIMPPVEVFDTVAEAVADCHYVLATTARLREMAKPVFTPRDAALEIRKREATRQKIALLFGAERSGLSNDEVALAHGIINIPLNPGFSSLNLGQAVLLVAYEWWAGQKAGHAPVDPHSPAPHEQFHDLTERLERELDARGFFRAPELKPSVARNLKTMLARADMSEQEIRTFHGVMTVLMREEKDRS
jgi:tRNA/rRNA methyltransferase